MSLKRKLDQRNHMSVNSKKRHRDEDDNERGYATASKIDPTTGQRGAFPDLDTEDGAEESSLDALRYLRSVRTEALGVPNLLVAVPSHPKARELNDDHEGFYEDGAYASYAVHRGDNASEDDPTADEAQNAYYHSLLDRFDSLRRQLHVDPGSFAKSTSSFATALKIRNSKWTHAFKTQPPRPSHFISLTQDEIDVSLHRIETLLASIQSSKDEIINNIATWTWSILAKCRSIDEMGSEEVCTLRSLAKRASQLLGSTELIDTQPDDEQAKDHDDDEDDYGEEGDDSVGQAPGPERDFDEPLIVGAQLLQKRRDDLLNALVEDDQTSQSKQVAENEGSRPHSTNQHACSAKMRALLDMIITIVGERYGQRDLLIHRTKWSDSVADIAKPIA